MHDLGSVEMIADFPIFRDSAGMLKATWPMDSGNYEPVLCSQQLLRECLDEHNRTVNQTKLSDDITRKLIDQVFQCEDWKDLGLEPWEWTQLYDEAMRLGMAWPTCHKLNPLFKEWRYKPGEYASQMKYCVRHVNHEGNHKSEGGAEWL